MPILVIGRTGQVARALAERDVEGRMTFAGRPELDLQSPRTVMRSFELVRPELVVNAAAYTAVDAAETDAETAFAINRDGPAVLADACAQYGIPLIHLSTDYVFDGTKTGSYSEDDPPCPVSVYGESKWQGEEAIRARLDRHIILRTAWVYAPEGKNFALTMLKLGRERPELRIVADQQGSPTASDDIAAAIRSLIARCLGGGQMAWGTYHYACLGATTWYGFAEAIFAGAAPWYGTAPKLVAIATADYPTPARRPANSVLDCTKITNTFGVDRSFWRVSLTRTLDRIGWGDGRKGTT